MKNKAYSFTILLSSILLVVLLSSCVFGLGAAVDMTAPTVTITSHEDNDSVAETFVLRGTATDNVGVESMTVNLADAGISYKITVGGQWYKKTYTTTDWVAIPDDAHNYCTGGAASLSWSVEIDTSDRNPLKNDKSYTVTVSATDKMQNSGKKSNPSCTVKLDTASPDVSIYKPELQEGTYAEISAETAAFKLNDGNYLSRLVNGTLALYGRQSQALSSKELLIEFDNGQLQSGVRKSTADSTNAVTSVEEVKALSEAQFAGDGSPTVYFSKKLTGDQLSDWTVTVTPEEWATNESGIANGLNAGKHIIRVVTTSLSGSDGWERKILGYFVWWPESDIPWVTVSSCDEEEKATGIYECYQNSNISGNAYDDDGVKSIVSVISKYDETTQTYIPGTPVVHYSNEESDVTYAAFSAKVPADNGKFRIVVTVTDINDIESSVTRYFKTADISAPRIEITSPVDNAFAMNDASGDITFIGTASDDVGIVELSVVWLNPKKSSDLTNKITYLTGNETAWSKATAGGFTDAAGNKVYQLYKGAKKTEFVINKTFNLFNDFGIGTNDTYLTAQDFIFRVKDEESSTIKSVTLTGDSTTPSLAFSDITINGNTQSFENGNIPTYPAMSNVTATVTGTWSDTFNSTLVNTKKVYAIELSWGTGSSKKTATVTPNENGTWQTTIAAPPSGGTLTATIKDYGGNTKTVQAAANIETAAWRLDRIDCQNDDGTYKKGDTLFITLEFTKNTDVSGNPTLTLNNGGTATYVSGSGAASHVFGYIVGSGTAAEKDTLSVTAINANGATWGDSALSGRDTVDLLAVPAANLDSTRTITIDNTPPRVKSVTALSAAGHYKAGASLLFKVEFSEDVTITGNDMVISFLGNLKTTSSTVSGSKLALFTYNVESGDNSIIADGNLGQLTFSSMSGTTVKVKDAAGNELTNWTPVNTPSFSGMYIDNTPPAVPTFKNDWEPGKLIIADAGTSFELDGIEAGATAEYSLDNGTNWIPYTTPVSLTNNGSYNVTARQTDIAGNVSGIATVKTFTIDKGDLLKRITASTVNGTYSTKTSTKEITGKIEFRRSVTIAQNAYVTLNVKGSDNNFKTCKLNECKVAAGKGTVFTFTYTIEEGDAISAQDGKLDVTAWNLPNDGTFEVSIGDQAFTVPFPTGNGKTFAENRSIKIQTGVPTIDSAEFNDEGNLVVTFSRAVSKGTGSISLVYDHNHKTGETNDNDFRVPVVLTADEYNELMLRTEDVTYTDGGSSTTKTVKEIIQSAYTAGMNGAKYTTNGFEFDTTTKYILAYDKTNTDPALVAAFTGAGKDQITIPLIANGVDLSVDGKTLTVKLTGSYQIPVKGAYYKLTIPAEAFTDSVKNLTEVYTTDSLLAPGVESPQFRLKTSAATITYKTNTAGSSTDMSEAQTATLKMDCRTPGATIKYGLNEKKEDAFTINSGIKANITPTYARYITKADSEDQLYSDEITLGDGKLTNTYDAAAGYRFGISAVATKNFGTEEDPDNKTSEVSYEYAARSVLKLNIGAKGKYGNGNDANNYNKDTDIKESSKTLKLIDLKVWVMGGDSSSGPNSLSSTPLSWEDHSKVKLMAGKHSTTTDMTGQWWWVSWDIVSPTYVGFVVGDVPSDAASNGPKTWYYATYHWVPLKDMYRLFPGDTLIMSVDSNSTSLFGQQFTFDPGLKGTR